MSGNVKEARSTLCALENIRLVLSGLATSIDAAKIELNPNVRPVAHWQVKRLSSLLVPDELLAMVIEQAMETDGEI